MPSLFTGKDSEKERRKEGKQGERERGKDKYAHEQVLGLLWELRRRLNNHFLIQSHHNLLNIILSGRLLNLIACSILAIGDEVYVWL